MKGHLIKGRQDAEFCHQEKFQLSETKITRDIAAQL